MTRRDSAPDDLAAVRRAAGLVVLDRLPYALLVVDAGLRPVIMNARARQAIATAPGLRLEDGALTATDDIEHQTLRASVAAATKPTASWLSGATAFTLTVGAAAVPVLVLPEMKPDPLLGLRGLACLVFGDAAPMPHRELLQAMYAFTGREGDLASGLMAGQTLAEASKALGMAMPTARSHLQRLLEKTGTQRQGELLRVLFGSAACPALPSPE